MSYRRALWAAVLAAALSLSPAPALAGPVATSDSAYQGLGRVFPDPQGRADCGGPCSPLRQGNVGARSFIGFTDFEKALKYMNTKPEWQRFLEVWPLDDGKFDGNNLSRLEFSPNKEFQSAGLPTSSLGRQKSDLYVLRVTDESVPDAGKKRYALSLSIHGIERAGVEGGVRAMEDLVTAATVPSASGKGLRLDDKVLTTKGLSVPVPTFRDVLQSTIIYFTFPNPDGWRRGEVEQGGVFFQRYNGNGVDPNRDWPDKGFSFRPYSAFSEPESRGLSSALLDIKDRGGPFAAGDDLHGQLGADSFSYTLIPHGKKDYAKNERIQEAAKTINLVQQDALSWSPLIQPNSAPPPSCVPGPVSDDCPKMYGQSWGSVYDTIDYTTTGALGDWFDSTLGLHADGIDNEMAYSHLDKNTAFDPQIEQLHVDGNKTLIYAHLAEILSQRGQTFGARGRKGYVPLRRVQGGERPLPAVPPGTQPQADIDAQATGSPSQITYDFEVKQDAQTFNGGMRVDITEPNAQGINPTALTHGLAVQCKGCDRHAGVKDSDEWVTVAEDYNQSGLYLQAGLTAAVNYPQAAASGKPVQWRAVVSNASGPVVNVHVDFTSGPATSDAATGGDSAPRQRAYDVASTDFWNDLNPFAPKENQFDALDPAALAKGDATVPDALDTVVVTDQPLPGYALPPIPGQEVTPGTQPEIAFTQQRATVPCAYQSGTPRNTPCTDGPTKFKVERGTSSVRVRIDFTAPNDLALEVVQRDAEGNEKNAYYQDGGEPSEVIDIPKPEAGDYEVYVHNFSAPQSDYKGKITFGAKEVPQRAASDFSDEEFARYVGKLRDFVSGGGNLVLTDGALQMLPYLFDKIARDKITERTVYAGQVTFSTKASTSKDPGSEGNTLKDPLAARVAQPGARFNVGLRRQTYEPTPVGFSIQNAVTGGDESHSREWEVDRKAFEAAGGRIAGTGVNSGTRGAAAVDSVVTLGELALGQGKVRVIGALLPQPTEEFDHQEGLESYALTYTGYLLAQNLTDYCKPGRTCTPIAQPAARSATKRALKQCLPKAGFRSVGASRKGRGLRLAFQRAERRRVNVDVFQSSLGRRVLGERRVARFRNRTKSFTWSGRGRKVRDGIFFVRYSMKLGDGRTDVRRVTVARRKGRFSRRPAFYGREGCATLTSYKLERPAFGGRTNRPLRVAYRLSKRARVSVSVLRGKKVIKRYKASTRAANVTHRLRIRAERLRRGDYRVRIRVQRTGQRTITSTLTARRV